MLFAYCMACFEALLGFFYVEKKSVAIAKSFFDTQPVYQQSGATALNTVEMHKGSFPVQKLESAFGASALFCPSPGGAPSSSHGPS